MSLVALNTFNQFVTHGRKIFGRSPGTQSLNLGVIWHEPCLLHEEWHGNFDWSCSYGSQSISLASAAKCSFCSLRGVATVTRKQGRGYLPIRRSTYALYSEVSKRGWKRDRHRDGSP